MANERNEEYKNMSVEEMVKKLQQEKHRIIEEFAKAYLAESGLLPSEVELVTQQITTDKNTIEHRYFFRRKT